MEMEENAVFLSYQEFKKQYAYKGAESVFESINGPDEEDRSGLLRFLKVKEEVKNV
jgi:hypothetical protein|tara:strand:+ start:164 stop:331 length:168 start_codon:yes stop_codon:yes gene_type:complete